MGRRVRRDPDTTRHREVDQGPEDRWTGRLECDITTPGGGFLGLLEFVLRYDQVSVFYADRNMGLVDRGRMHRWFQQPTEPLRLDDVTLSVRGRDVLMALDKASPFPLPRRLSAQLQMVV